MTSKLAVELMTMIQINMMMMTMMMIIMMMVMMLNEETLLAEFFVRGT